MKIVGDISKNKAGYIIDSDAMKKVYHSVENANNNIFEKDNSSLIPTIK